MYSYNNYLLFLESKRELQLRKKYVDKLEMNEEIFNKFYSNKNAEWLLKIYSNISEEKKKEIDNKGGRTLPEILLMYVEMFDNNKDNVSVNQISEIDSLDEMKQILDELRDFDGAENKYGDDIWVLCNSYEWFTFKPLCYDASELANNKLRESNWCTTYDEKFWKTHLGPEGGLIYICNKLDKTKDVAIELNGEIKKTWNWKDYDTIYSSLEELIKDTWQSFEEPYNILISNIKKLKNDIPTIDYDKARENAIDEIMNWEYYRYNDLVNYSTYVWRHIDDDRFLSDIKDNEYERYQDEWKYENNLIERFISILEKNYEVKEKEILKYFTKQIIIKNKKNVARPDDNEYYNVEDIDIDNIIEYINDNCTNKDAKNLINIFDFEDQIIEVLVDEYMNNFSDAEDYVNNMFGRTNTDEAISQIKNYIDYRDLAIDIVDDMDEEELRNYL